MENEELAKIAEQLSRGTHGYCKEPEEIEPFFQRLWAKVKPYVMSSRVHIAIMLIIGFSLNIHFTKPVEVKVVEQEPLSLLEKRLNTDIDEKAEFIQLDLSKFERGDNPTYIYNVNIEKYMVGVRYSKDSTVPQHFNGVSEYYMRYEQVDSLDLNKPYYDEVKFQEFKTKREESLKDKKGKESK